MNDPAAGEEGDFVKMADFTKGWTVEGDLLSGGHTVAPVAPSRQFSGIGAISITPPETEPFWLRALGLDGLMPKADERGLTCGFGSWFGETYMMTYNHR